MLKIKYIMDISQDDEILKYNNDKTKTITEGMWKYISDVLNLNLKIK